MGVGGVLEAVKLPPTTQEEDEGCGFKEIKDNKFKWGKENLGVAQHQDVFFSYFVPR